MSDSVNWIIVAGARPNFMKIAPLIKAIDAYNLNHDVKSYSINRVIVHTGQHYDEAMSKIFFDELDIPKPDINLGIGSGGHGEQTGRVMIEFEKVCLKEKPDMVIVVGDVNSTMACTLVAVKLGIKVAHIEAGLRSNDRSMPEEINRIVTDSISDYLLTTCLDANDNLKREGIAEDKTFFVGNLMVDTLFSHKDKSNESNILETLNLVDGKDISKYALLTLHRPSNVDNQNTFHSIIEPIRELSKRIPVIFAAHVRTRKQIEEFGMEKYFTNSSSVDQSARITLIDPLGYLDFLKLMSNATLVLSDSGGIQEETTILGIPCLTIRENTERPVTITEGTNTLLGPNYDKLLSYANNVLRDNMKECRIPALWDGKSAERIVAILTSGFSNPSH